MKQDIYYMGILVLILRNTCTCTLEYLCLYFGIFVLQNTCTLEYLYFGILILWNTYTLEYLYLYFGILLLWNTCTSGILFLQNTCTCSNLGLNIARVVEELLRIQAIPGERIV